VPPRHLRRAAAPPTGSGRREPSGLGRETGPSPTLSRLSFASCNDPAGRASRRPRPPPARSRRGGAPFRGTPCRSGGVLRHRDFDQQLARGEGVSSMPLKTRRGIERSPWRSSPGTGRRARASRRQLSDGSACAMLPPMVPRLRIWGVRSTASLRRERRRACHVIAALDGTLPGHAPIATPPAPRAHMRARQSGSGPPHGGRSRKFMAE